MKQLTCEMCGSTQMKKEDGVFVCEACGMKYSADEAKKLLVEVDSTPMIENYLEVARNAEKAGNNKEAETYANKILEITPNCAEAWYIKGIAAGWQSTLANTRFAECVECWSQVLNYCETDKEKNDFCNQICSQVVCVSNAIIDLVADNGENFKRGEDIVQFGQELEKIKIFINNINKIKDDNIISSDIEKLVWSHAFEKLKGVVDEVFSNAMSHYAQFPSSQNVDDVKTVIKSLREFFQKVRPINYTDIPMTEVEKTQRFSKSINNIFNGTNVFLGSSIFEDEMENEIWTNATLIINNLCVDASHLIQKRYGPEKSDKTIYAYRTFKEDMYGVLNIYYTALQFCRKTGLVVTICENAMVDMSELNNSCYYAFKTYSSGSGYYYDGGLTDEERKFVSELWQKFEKLRVDKIEQLKDLLREPSVEIKEGFKNEKVNNILIYDLIEDCISLAPTKALYILKAIALLNTNFLNNLDLAYECLLNALSAQEDAEYSEILEENINYCIGEKLWHLSGAKNSKTVLALAVSKYDVDCVKMLLEFGADVNAKSYSGVTPLWYIASQEIEEEKLESARELAKLLLDNGAKVDIENENGIALFNAKTDLEIAKMILEKYPDAQRGSAPASSSSSTGGGGCYVATAVYGSYDCPQVWTLRRYRDNTLASTWYGRAFIRTYYAISPTLVKWFGETEWFKKMWQGKLDKMVEKLQNEGVESTPYDDINW